ncbi:hypothetical protein XBJ1_3559 [Xenorhabdus bovienii SS-2004]|uniref:Uncharacterized protein n=2 Tax=Xenorhabdus bovienii TaxID=40576 RepID=D3V4U8_XENBS|nr:hypothetical protein XBJ1_3559 [Xenorhabdus bovienii SS-2004]
MLLIPELAIGVYLLVPDLLLTIEADKQLQWYSKDILNAAVNISTLFRQYFSGH